jgi:L-fucose isomerase-like protein
MKIKLIKLRSILSQERDLTLDESSKRFLDEISKGKDLTFSYSDGDIEMYFIETGGSEEPFLAQYKHQDKPYYLLATGNANSLASSLEILSFLQKEKKDGTIIFGTPEEIYKQIMGLKKGKKEPKLLENKRVGIIGEPSNWLISSSLNFKKAQEIFGIEFIKIPFQELKEEIDSLGAVNNLFDEGINQVFGKSPFYKGAIKIYLGLKELIKKYQLYGFSLRCFDLLGEYKNTACLALSMLNKEGIVSSCEGDETSLLSMCVIKALTNQSAFQCNPSSIDKTNNNIILAHCAVPLDMVKNIECFTHYESNLGIGIRGKFDEENITLFKLSSALDNYHCYEGKIMQNLERNDLCRTQVLVHLNEDFSSLYLEPFGNHLILVKGHIKGLISEKCRL